MVPVQLIVMGLVLFAAGVAAIVHGAGCYADGRYVLGAHVAHDVSLRWLGIAWMAAGGLAVVYGLALMFLVPRMVH